MQDRECENGSAQSHRWAFESRAENTQRRALRLPVYGAPSIWGRPYSSILSRNGARSRVGTNDRPKIPTPYFPIRNGPRSQDRPCLQKRVTGPVPGTVACAILVKAHEIDNVSVSASRGGDLRQYFLSLPFVFVVQHACRDHVFMPS